MGDLGARLKRLEQSAGSAAGRLVVVQPAFGPEGTPGEIRPWQDRRNGVTLYVPIESAGDPTAGLTDDQRAAIGPNDKVITVAYVTDWRASE